MHLDLTDQKSYKNEDDAKFFGSIGPKKWGGNIEEDVDTEKFSPHFSMVEADEKEFRARCFIVFSRRGKKSGTLFCVTVAAWTL